MSGIATILFYTSSAVSLICFVLVLVAIYQNGSSGIAIACAISFLLFGIGVLIAMIYGWIKSAEWGITKIMLLWTLALLVAFICYYIAPLSFARTDLPDV